MDDSQLPKSHPVSFTKITYAEMLSLLLGFSAVGAFVGTIAGISSADTTIPLLGAVFALIGGSVSAFLGRMSPATRISAGIALIGFGLTATLGLYIGIDVKINRRLDVSSARSLNDYMRSQSSKPLVEFLTSEVSSGNTKLLDACATLMKSPAATGSQR